MKKTALIEPFYTASHKYWADEIIDHSSHQITLFSLPGRHWKWRMHHSAITLATQVNNSNQQFDAFLVSDMMDLSLFKSLLKSTYKNIPVLFYFHENQLTYPFGKSKQEQTNHHYAWINFSSALVADQIAFNSAYNRSSFFEKLLPYLKQFPDFQPTDEIELLHKKSHVLHLGVDVPTLEKTTNSLTTILWNHRWEHDKNPELFFHSLFKLKEENISFQLVVLGESYSKYPPIFNEAKQRLANEIIHWGYAASKKDYWFWLNKCDLLPVTSNHDFFGISVVEAIKMGCPPLLPNRMSYPELIKKEFHEGVFYTSDNEFYDRLKKMIKNREPLHNILIKEFCWSEEINNYDNLLEMKN